MDIERTLDRLLTPEGGSLALEARAPERGLARSWRIVVDRDLFGRTCLVWNWGRIGTRGQGKSLSFADPQAARGPLRALLRRRLRAPRRIAVSYRPVEAGPHLHWI